MIEQLKEIAEGGQLVVYLAGIYLMGKLVIFLGKKIMKINEDQIKKLTLELKTKDATIDKLTTKLETCSNEKLNMQIEFSKRLLENEKAMIESYEILTKSRS